MARKRPRGTKSCPGLAMHPCLSAAGRTAGSEWVFPAQGVDCPCRKGAGLSAVGPSPCWLSLSCLSTETRPAGRRAQHLACPTPVS